MVFLFTTSIIQGLQLVPAGTPFTPGSGCGSAPSRSEKLSESEDDSSSSPLEKSA